MDRVLLAAAASFAALAVPAAPAGAQQADAAFAHSRPPHFVPTPPVSEINGCDSARHGHHGMRGDSGCEGFGWAYADGEWALYNNRSWDSDSYNDWWHDRPDRAFPRWVRHNQNCTPDRMWWSGSGWHC